MRNRKFLVICFLVLVLGTSLCGLFYLLFGPKETIDYIPTYPPKESYSVPHSSMRSVAPMRKTTAPVVIYTRPASSSQSSSPMSLVVPMSHYSSSATSRTFGVMPYSGGGSAQATGSTYTQTTNLNGTGAPVMPLTNFTVLTQAKVLAERTASSKPAVAEAAPAQMARTATAPRYAPGPPNTGGGLEPGHDPGNNQWQLVEPEETPVGSALVLLLFLAAYILLRRRQGVSASVLVLAIGLVIFPMDTFAAAKKNKGSEIEYNSRRPTNTKPRWKSTRNPSTGLYTMRNLNVANGVSLNANLLYYYGDIDMLDLAFQHGFQPQNLSVGGSLIFGYLHPLGRQCNWRFTIGGGYLHGNDSARYDTGIHGEKIPAGKGKFNSFFAEGAAGVEWYPFPRAGFYIYGGLGASFNYIKYDFFKIKDHPQGNMFTVLPMLQGEIGYNFYLGKNFFLAIEVSVHQGLLDVGGCSLDAWPVKKSSRFQWGDGYFQIGVTFAYKWYNCETCRLRKW